MGTLLGIVCILLSAILKQYTQLVHLEHHLLAVVNPLFMPIGHVLILICLPFFTLHILGFSINKKLQLTFPSLAILLLLNHLLCKTTISPLLFSIINRGSILGVCFFSVIFIGLYYKNIGEKIIRITFKRLFFLLLIFIPYITFDLIVLPEYRLSLPLFFSILNLGAAFFIFEFFNRPSYSEQNKVTSYFCKNFELTLREAEIINFVLSGLKNKEIGDSLNISLKTVESHIYNIYQKTGVRNRMQLMNLVLTNQK
jgi:DNA-binding CsgD family transcriptional regulator